MCKPSWIIRAWWVLLLLIFGGWQVNQIQKWRCAVVLIVLIVLDVWTHFILTRTPGGRYHILDKETEADRGEVETGEAGIGNKLLGLRSLPSPRQAGCRQIVETVGIGGLWLHELCVFTAGLVICESFGETAQGKPSQHCWVHVRFMHTCGCMCLIFLVGGEQTTRLFRSAVTTYEQHSK